jgi:hypothetical protein
VSAQIDPALEAAVFEAVKEAGQPDATARRLIGWLTELSGGELTVDDNEQSLRLVLSTLIVKGRSNED